MVKYINTTISLALYIEKTVSLLVEMRIGRDGSLSVIAKW